MILLQLTKQVEVLNDKATCSNADLKAAIITVGCICCSRKGAATDSISPAKYIKQIFITCGRRLKASSIFDHDCVCI